MPLGTEVGLGLRDIVLDGDPTPTPLKGHSLPQFSGNVRCGQAAEWTKMPLGMGVGQTAGWVKTQLGTEVDLGPGQLIIVLFEQVSGLYINIPTRMQELSFLRIPNAVPNFKDLSQSHKVYDVQFFSHPSNQNK